MIIINNKLKLILGEIFVYLGVANAIVLILEFFRPGVVMAYVNTGFLLIFWLVIGIIHVVLNKEMV